jgi:L-fucose isomerase-like protein
MQRTTLGIIVGNRGFFPDHLCETGRTEILRVLKEGGINAVTLGPADTSFGSVETLEDAEKCAALFKEHAEEIDGILVTLPNFGEERGIANAVRLSGLNVPVLVQASPDEVGKMMVADRRDSFCGKMSVCNNLRQCGIPYTLTTLHTVALDSESFRQDLRQFAGTCRVVRGLRGARVGVLGARPAAFITVRYSEKLLEKAGISVESLDLSEAFGRANKLSDDAKVKAKLDEIKAYVPTKGTPHDALTKMAKFALVMEDWIAEQCLVATAVQCWTSMEEFFGVVPCTVMSMLSNTLNPSACETDITGAVGMYAMALASGKASALLDWNNNYGDDPDKGVIFHCSNLPKAFFSDMKMDYQEIIAGSVGKENTYGTVVGRILPSVPFTYCRVSTDDEQGVIRAYLGEGQVTDDPLETFGGYGVIEIPNFQKLLHHICENGFEHHVAVNLSQCATAVNEALNKYMGWDVYYHDTVV